ncbi:hypothetical protein J6590_072124 [Homalodisca vitripennis]|nr:hypothetical protein J6590_072124 [Homalodisca vitripennis]
MFVSSSGFSLCKHGISDAFTASREYWQTVKSGWSEDSLAWTLSEKKSEKAAESIAKEARQERRKRRLISDEQEEVAYEPQYGAGLF